MDFSDGLGAVAASGDRVATLRALRDVLAGQIECSGSGVEVASLARQLVQVLAEVDQLAPPARERTRLDEVTARRAARGGAETQRGSGRSGKRSG